MGQILVLVQKQDLELRQGLEILCLVIEFKHLAILDQISSISVTGSMEVVDILVSELLIRMQNLRLMVRSKLLEGLLVQERFSPVMRMGLLHGRLQVEVAAVEVESLDDNQIIVLVGLMRQHSELVLSPMMERMSELVQLHHEQSSELMGHFDLVRMVPL
jgi:K+ transporter